MAVCISTCTSISNIPAYVKIDLSKQILLQLQLKTSFDEEIDWDFPVVDEYRSCISHFSLVLLSMCSR